jgi:hypothetical protein
MEMKKRAAPSPGPPAPALAVAFTLPTSSSTKPPCTQMPCGAPAHPMPW